MEEIAVKRGAVQEVGLQDDPLLWSLNQARHAKGIAPSEGAMAWEAPFDLRVMRPFAVDLLKFWRLTKRPVPEAIQASLGPRIPILINHVVTPFACDGLTPGKVWGLGYEFALADGTEANTVSVLPSDEVLKIGGAAQKVEFGLQVGGGIGVPEGALRLMDGMQGVSLTGARIDASTDQRFQLSLRIEVTLRKVTGAPVGAGGAVWKMYRQDERLDRPHALIQTVLVSPNTSSLRCVVKTWAKQAGWLGGHWGARFWPYEDQHFDISLAGLSPAASH